LREHVELKLLSGPDPDILRRAEILIVARLPQEVISAAPNVRWINFWTAGLDNNALQELIERGVWITHSSGVHAPKIAAHLMACILMFCCRMPFFQRAQREHQWLQEPGGYDDLTGRTLGIAGLGRIGEALAVRASSFGMHILAVKRDVSYRHDPAAAIDRLYSPQDLPEMLSRADHVCITMRHTAETHHLFDARMLAHMKPDAYLYNTGRGRIVDEAALVAILRAGRLKGAALDVFESEPLSPESPLWEMENVIITPHVSGFNPHYFTRAAGLFAANLHRYFKGEPLNNAYDPVRGY
jgi:phosphoglycerate dehydrogenase-like enzyme